MNYNALPYKEARSAGAQVGRLFHSNLIGSGHSLGGGLSTTAALAGNYPTINFNAAGLNPMVRYSLGLLNRNAPILEYSVPNEILSQIGNITLAPSTDGKVLLLADPPDLSASPITRHFMGSVITSLKYELQQYHCQ